jgi:transcriptional regulator of arginine metabolism
MFMHCEARHSVAPSHFSTGFWRNMKYDRHGAIRELVGSSAVSNQDELRRMLLKRGFDVTQATLSRDIHELHLYKGPRGYALPNGANGHNGDDESQPSVNDVLSNFGMRVKQAMNQLVLATTNGGAQPVALAIDQAGWSEVVGTIAGDDTVLIICPDARQAAHLRTRIEGILS